jgi:hypothetical protein
VTGGWGKPTHETENCYRSEPAPENSQGASRPVQALLDAVLELTLILHDLLSLFSPLINHYDNHQQR